MTEIDLSKATVGSEWRRRDGVKVVCVKVDDSAIPFLGDDGYWRRFDGGGERRQRDIIAPWGKAAPQAREPSYEERLRDEVAMRLFVRAVLERRLQFTAEAAEAVFIEADAFMAERKKRGSGA